MNERETGRTADVETEGGMQADTEREKKNHGRQRRGQNGEGEENSKLKYLKLREINCEIPFST